MISTFLSYYQIEKYFKLFEKLSQIHYKSLETIQITCEPVAKYRILSSISQGKKWLSYKDFANRKHSGNH